MQDIQDAIRPDTVEVFTRVGESFRLSFPVSNATGGSWRPYAPYEPLERTHESFSPDPENEGQSISSHTFFSPESGTFELFMCFVPHQSDKVQEAVRHEVVVT